MVQLRKPIPNAEERIFDLSDKNTNTLESKLNLANSYLKLGFYKKAMQLFDQTLEARGQLLDDEHPEILRAMNSLAESFTKLGQNEEALQVYQQTLEVLRIGFSRRVDFHLPLNHSIRL